MTISMRPEHLKRYGQIARLLYRYGRSDIVRTAGLDDALASLEPEPAEPEAAGDGDAVAERSSPTSPEAEEGAAEGEGLAEDLERLGPTFVKLGQLLSTRADLLPAPYLEALSRLQDRLEPVPYEAIERRVHEELGVRISKAFAEFDETPLGSASLGQVHRAELRDGRPVAVKVQRPGIRDRVREDLEVLGELAGFLDEHTEAGRRYRFGATLGELRRTILRELDYRSEARNLVLLRENLAEFERILVPRPVDDYTTDRVLTMDFIHGRKVTALSPLRRLELDGAALADELFRAYLKQILVDGFFHADPHPGNVFLTADGRLALLDLGMVAHLRHEVQEALVKLVVAVGEGDADDAVETLLRLGDRTPEADVDAFRRDAGDLIARFGNATGEEMQMGAVLLGLNRLSAGHGVLAPPELTMLGKTLMNLDEVGRTLDAEFDPNAAIRANVADIMRRRMTRSLSPREMLSAALEMNEFVQRLPARLNRLLDNLAGEQFELRVHAIDEAKLVGGLQRIANRITLGLILAALIIGAAMLVRVETPVTILGYPALAIVFFLGAAAGGLWLVWSILRQDPKDRGEG